MSEKIVSIGANDQWTGEPLEPEEIEDMLSCLERFVGEVRAGRIRGFVLAGVSTSGVGATYQIVVKCKTGCSGLNLIGAAHLAAYETTALQSDIFEDRE